MRIFTSSTVATGPPLEPPLPLDERVASCARLPHGFARGVSITATLLYASSSFICRLVLLSMK